MSTLYNFFKMNGVGNKIIVLDMRLSSEEVKPEAIFALAQDPQMNFDQIMVIRSGDDTSDENPNHFKLEIFNSDATLAKACGNGTRCVAEYLFQKTGLSKISYQILDKTINSTRLDNGDICVDMGPANFEWDKIPLSHPVDDIFALPIRYPDLSLPAAVNVGNPHVVFWTDKSALELPIKNIGKEVENNALFPEGVNVSFVEIINSSHIKLFTWERGAGLTQACGSAACAATILSHKVKNTESKLLVTLLGGNLMINYRNDHIFMTGPTSFEFSGKLSVVTGQYQKDYS